MPASGFQYGTPAIYPVSMIKSYSIACWLGELCDARSYITKFVYEQFSQTLKFYSTEHMYGL